MAHRWTHPAPRRDRPARPAVRDTRDESVAMSRGKLISRLLSAGVARCASTTTTAMTGAPAIAHAALREWTTTRTVVDPKRDGFRGACTTTRRETRDETRRIRYEENTRTHRSTRRESREARRRRTWTERGGRPNLSDRYHLDRSFVLLGTRASSEICMCKQTERGSSWMDSLSRSVRASPGISFTISPRLTERIVTYDDAQRTRRLSMSMVEASLVP